MKVQANRLYRFRKSLRFLEDKILKEEPHYVEAELDKDGKIIWKS